MPGLEDLYREIILDHYRNPRNRGELPTPPAHRTEGFNPLCGDEVTVSVRFGDGDIIESVGFEGRGCAISQAATSMLANARLELGETTTREAEGPAGVVVEQSPRAGETVELGTAVQVWVAVPVRVEVPSLIGTRVDRGE